MLDQIHEIMDFNDFDRMFSAYQKSKNDQVHFVFVLHSLQWSISFVKSNCDCSFQKDGGAEACVAAEQRQELSFIDSRKAQAR